MVMTRSGKTKSVAEYIKLTPNDSRKKLREMRACISKAAPGATESLKWGMPAFSYRRILVIYGAFKHHIGFYPTSSAMKTFADELSKFVTSRGQYSFRWRNRCLYL